MPEYEEEKTESEKTNQKMVEIHQRHMRAFNRSYSATWEERELCLEERRFCHVPGAQWEGQLGELFENRPKLEINKAKPTARKIFSEYRNNRFGIDFISRDGADRDELADTCDRLHRADEQKSCAKEAYDTAFDDGSTGGMGAWRYRADLEDEYEDDNEYQTVYIEPIFDADSCVFFDADARRQTKSDAKMCWVLIPFTIDSFREEFNDDPVSWPKEIESSGFDWTDGEIVYVAEVYEIEHEIVNCYIYEKDGETEKYYDEDFESNPDLNDLLILGGWTKKEERKKKIRKVHKYLESGSGILEDHGYIAGKHIPIVPFYGERHVIDSIERMEGFIRIIKDISRVTNAEYSKLLEIASLSTVEKPIVTPDQMSGHGNMWAKDNIENYAALFLNPMTDSAGNPIPPAPNYTKVPNIPPALAALLQIAEQDRKEMLGNQEQGEKIVSNISGKVVEQIQDRIDMQGYIYISNFAEARKRGAEIWLSMKRDITVEKGRKMLGLGKDGERGFVEIMQPVVDPETKETIYKNDFRDANFDIFVDIGPSSSSKRKKIVSQARDILQATTDPETKTVLESIIMMNMEGEGMQEVRQYFRKKLIRLGVVKPNEDELQELVDEMQNAPPNANEEYLKSAAQNEQAKAVKAAADTKKIVADTEKTIAETGKILSEMEKTDQETAIRSAEAISQSISGPRPSVNLAENQSGNQPAAQSVENTFQG